MKKAGMSIKEIRQSVELVLLGKYPLVGAGTVVTKDVPDYAVVVGNPAKVIKMLVAEKFSDTEIHPS